MTVENMRYTREFTIVDDPNRPVLTPETMEAIAKGAEAMAAKLREVVDAATQSFLKSYERASARFAATVHPSGQLITLDDVPRVIAERLGNWRWRAPSPPADWLETKERVLRPITHQMTEISANVRKLLSVLSRSGLSVPSDMIGRQSIDRYRIYMLHNEIIMFVYSNRITIGEYTVPMTNPHNQ